MVQWLRLCTSTAEGVGSNPGQGTKILRGAQEIKKKKKRMRFFVWGSWNMTDVLMRGEAGHVKTQT